jgi:hypothetical protein
VRAEQIFALSQCADTLRIIEGGFTNAEAARDAGLEISDVIQHF